MSSEPFGMLLSSWRIFKSPLAFVQLTVELRGVRCRSLGTSRRATSFDVRMASVSEGVVLSHVNCETRLAINVELQTAQFLKILS